ncbi:MAG: terminase [Gemmatimonadaceae bacterium]
MPALTLGWGVLEDAARLLRQPNGPRAGLRWQPTDSQARFLLWWYAVDAEGRWLFHHGVRRLAKGSGKSPFAAVWALEELVGPVRVDFFDADAPGGVVGKPVAMPLVQIAATAESQTANTMRMVRAMTSKGSRIVTEHQLDVGKTIIYAPNGGQLEVITSSASAAEGAEVTAAVLDETEHWTTATGGPALAATLDRNLAKSSARGIETANAWEPGIGSVAESSYDAWVAQQEGRTRGQSRILYDARVAPADTDLADEESLTRALRFVYDDCFWVDLRTIAERVWDPRTPPDVSRRFYLNQPVASADAWVAPTEWAALADPSRVVADGEAVVLFFDGSKDRDATALVGCCMSDGHVFCVDVWEPDGRGDEVPVQAIDAAVERCFDRWMVLGFFADVVEWQGFVKVTWPERYSKRLKLWSVPSGKEPQSIAWDMRSRVYDFTMAVETTHAEILDRKFTHDGDSRLARHVGNARRRPGRWGVSISKESKDSSRKIDAAVCLVGARMVRRLALAAGLGATKRRVVPARLR